MPVHIYSLMCDMSPIMKIAGTTYCPSDAHKSIQIISDYILKTKGGDGVVREILDLITNTKRRLK